MQVFAEGNKCFPHVSGGGPSPGSLQRVAHAFFPRERGWSGRVNVAGREAPVFPT